MAATTPEDARLWISPGVGSNYGRCVDIWAPGSDILSASHRSDRATEYRSGTSQAVPFVAGAAVLFLQNSTGEPHHRAHTGYLSPAAAFLQMGCHVTVLPCSWLPSAVFSCIMHTAAVSATTTQGRPKNICLASRCKRTSIV